MRHLLPLLPKPSHFAGSEHGAAHKDPAKVSARLALAFPDLYQVGMSYTGMSILYNAVNACEEFWAERVFAPSVEAGRMLREHGAPLCTLESDTPLGDLDAVGFHLTHELCFTNVLYMLDLAGLSLRSEERAPDCPDWSGGPLILAGGGCAFNAEPLAPFVDLMILGDGEEVLLEILAAVARARQERMNKRELLHALHGKPGMYVPSLFEPAPGAHAPGTGGTIALEPLPGPVEKRLAADLDQLPYPTLQPQPFGAVHDRLTLEIARGCTRGCRFCHAGMVYRPARERSLKKLDELLQEGLDRSGYGEVSFLSLSAGDFSALGGLFTQSLGRCLAEQVSVSLPSLRAGSVSPEILAAMAGIRRTGATIAPEAGSARLRAVINKGITEEQLLEHTRLLFGHGWQHVKLYFMIGLPTETEADLQAIADLCAKVLDTGRTPSGKLPGRLQVTVSISPFVPKPHTPFQWERQITRQEIVERIGLLRQFFAPHKRIKLRWHEPETSFLEGVFSRGDRALARVLELAYAKGALFTSWSDSLRLDLWLEALDQCGLEPEAYLAARDLDADLPWDHLSSGVSRKFLLRERERAYKEAATPDCRYGACANCGVCTHLGHASLLRDQSKKLDIRPRLNLAARDQDSTPPDGGAADSTVAAPPSVGEAKPKPPPPRREMVCKEAHVRLWYEKTGPAVYLSQLETQSVFERAMRRARLPLAFSQGHHPAPLMSFCRAIPVGVASQAEYLDIFLREPWPPEEVLRALGPEMIPGMAVLKAESLSMGRKQPISVQEEYVLQWTGADGEWRERREQLEAFLKSDSHPLLLNSKRGARTRDARPLVADIQFPDQTGALITFDWSETYISPLNLLRGLLPDLDPTRFGLTKLRQVF